LKGRESYHAKKARDEMVKAFEMELKELGNFHPQILRYCKRASLELPEAILALYALDGVFLSVRRGKTTKEPMYMALGIKPDGRREILGFWLFGAEGESAWNWEEVLKDLRRREAQRVRIFITEDLPRLEEAIKKIFPEADGPLCPARRAGCAS